MLDIIQAVMASREQPVKELDSELIGKEISDVVYGWHVNPTISDPAKAVTYPTLRTRQK